MSSPVNPSSSPSFNPALRLSDADRDAASGRLRDAYAEGRLSDEEFHERTDRVLAARTGADLAPLTADLPVPVSAPAVTVEQLAHRRELRKIWTAWASMAILLIAVWVLTALTSDDVPAFWPAWPLGITGALAVVRTINVRNADGETRGDADGAGPSLSRAGSVRARRRGRRPR